MPFDPVNPLLTTPEEVFHKKILEEHQNHIKQLSAETVECRDALEAAKKNNCQVSNYLESCVLERDEEIRELRQTLLTKTHDFEENLTALRKELQDQLASAKGEANTMELSLRRQVAELKEDNKQLLHFRKQQKDWETQLSERNEELRHKAAELEACDLGWHQRMAQHSATLEEHYKSKLDTAMREFNSRAHEEVANTLVMHETKISRYKDGIDEFKLSKQAWDKERDAMKAEVLRWKTDADLYKKQCMEMTSQLTNANKNNAELYHACKALKKRVEILMAAMVEKEKRRATVDDDKENNDDNLKLVCIQDSRPSSSRASRTPRTPRIPVPKQSDVDARIKALEKKNRELKQWGQRLIDVRTEEETFLLEAIAESKAKRRELAILGTQDTNPVDSVRIDENGDKQVQIEDSSWRQREEILKMMFRKINEREGEVHKAKNQLSLRTHET